MESGGKRKSSDQELMIDLKKLFTIIQTNLLTKRKIHVLVFNNSFKLLYHNILGNEE
jgi:hypothetical protein